MNDKLTISAQDAIKEYIDSVGDEKIESRALEKLESIQRVFLASIHEKLKPIYKNSNNIKMEAEKIMKKKPSKNLKKAEKLSFNHRVIDELIRLIRNNSYHDDFVESHNEFLKKVKFIKSWDKYEQWLSWALEFGGDSYLATHIAKLTHSSSKGSSVDVRYYNSCNRYDSQYVCTPRDPILDTAYPDNKYSSISQLYNVCVGGRYIGDLLREADDKYLRPFTKHDELLRLWVSGFSNSIKSKNKQSYFLSKQTYFPVQAEKYHLLMPLTSSSLVHALHLEHRKYWDEAQESARKQRSNKKYSATVTCTYPNKAYLHVTGSNHSNASSLNGKRGGRIALLSAMPPQWRSRMSSYVNKDTLFDKALSFELREEIDELRNYLLLIKNKSISISEPKRNAAVMNKLQAISSQFFNYLETINANELDRGWTANSKLPPEQQLAFEPWRKDEVAMALKVNKSWQKSLSQNYGRWLNQQLSKKLTIKPTTVHAALWADCFLVELREMVATQEVTL